MAIALVNGSSCCVGPWLQWLTAATAIDPGTVLAAAATMAAPAVHARGHVDPAVHARGFGWELLRGARWLGMAVCAAPAARQGYWSFFCLLGSLQQTHEHGQIMLVGARLQTAAPPPPLEIVTIEARQSQAGL